MVKAQRYLFSKKTTDPLLVCTVTISDLVLYVFYLSYMVHLYILSGAA